MGVIDERVDVALHRSIATGRVGIEAAARLDGEVRRLLHRLHREIFGRVDDDRPLATDPGNNRGPVFVIMAPTGLAFLAAPTRAASQRLLPTVRRLPLVSRSMVEVIRFYGAFHLALGFVGHGRIPQPPTPAIAGTNMDSYRFCRKVAFSRVWESVSP